MVCLLVYLFGVVSTQNRTCLVFPTFNGTLEKISLDVTSCLYQVHNQAKLATHPVYTLHTWLQCGQQDAVFGAIGGRTVTTHGDLILHPGHFITTLNWVKKLFLYVIVAYPGLFGNATVITANLTHICWNHTAPLANTSAEWGVSATSADPWLWYREFYRPFFSLLVLWFVAMAVRSASRAA